MSWRLSCFQRDNDAKPVEMLSRRAGSYIPKASRKLSGVGLLQP